MKHKQMSPVKKSNESPIEAIVSEIIKNSVKVRKKLSLPKTQK